MGGHGGHTLPLGTYLTLCRLPAAGLAGNWELGMPEQWAGVEKSAGLIFFFVGSCIGSRNVS